MAATPGAAAVSLSELGVESRLAILFGTEEEGLSQAALEEADERVTVPMFGFTESFNVSVHFGRPVPCIVQRQPLRPLW